MSERKDVNELLAEITAWVRENPADLMTIHSHLGNCIRAVLNDYQTQTNQSRNAVSAALLLVDNKRMNWPDEFKAAIIRQVSNTIGMPGNEIEREFLERVDAAQTVSNE